jgi:tRNA 2-thiouridine synthesizing protein A
MPKTIPAAVPLADLTLDIRREVCPMTFVRTRLALDRMAPGQTLLVLLRGEEPRRNVPASAAALGHTVLREESEADGSFRLWLRRA